MINLIQRFQNTAIDAQQGGVKEKKYKLDILKHLHLKDFHY